MMNKLMLGLLAVSTLGISALPAIAGNNGTVIHRPFWSENSRPSNNDSSCNNWLYQNKHYFPQILCDSEPNNTSSDGNEECQTFQTEGEVYIIPRNCQRNCRIDQDHLNNVIQPYDNLNESKKHLNEIPDDQNTCNNNVLIRHR